jgi:GntR family transcriptional repressor for pyruvate dehydrogenase complex
MSQRGQNGQNGQTTTGHTASFDPVTRRTISAEIRQRLADAIHSGQLAPGTPLPAERVLCQEFGVARTSVREAIQGLVIAGYLERRGNRSVVAERLPAINFTGDDRKALVTQLFEVRQVIEPAIVEMAARRATDAERAEIGQIAARTTRTLVEFREIDRAFHAALARACGNPLLNEVHAKALAALFGSGEFESLLYAEVNRAEVIEIIDSSTEAHRAIADAVVKGHSRKAAAAVVAHLDDVERRMVERLL